jgi:hypothetical protein
MDSSVQQKMQPVTDYLRRSLESVNTFPARQRLNFSREPFSDRGVFCNGCVS